MVESVEQQRARLAYEASLRALDQQQRFIEEIRSRMGVLVATTSLTASLLGTRAFAGHAGISLTLLAVPSLLTTLVFGIVVLVPRKQLVFSILGSALHHDLAGVSDLAEQHRRLALWLDAFWRRNEPPIRRLHACFQFAVGPLVAQILVWTLSVTGSL